MVEGDDLSQLANEAGGHRIQRIPPTERRGRVHTSTVTVSVTDPASVPALDIRDEDIEIGWYSGSGAGGQFRNKTQNSCRLVHKPTGITATAQTRSRENSYKEARAALAQRVADQQGQAHHRQLATLKRDQVGSGMRGDKIRTVRFQDDQARDHRTDRVVSAHKYLDGHMDQLW